MKDWGGLQMIFHHWNLSLKILQLLEAEKLSQPWDIIDNSKIVFKLVKFATIYF
jgi:hypothetical protein